MTDSQAQKRPQSATGEQNQQYRPAHQQDNNPQRPSSPQQKKPTGNVAQPNAQKQGQRPEHQKQDNNPWASDAQDSVEKDATSPWHPQSEKK